MVSQQSTVLKSTRTNALRAILLSIGVSGFLFQVLLTEGLQREKAGRATNLIVSRLFSIQHRYI